MTRLLVLAIALCWTVVAHADTRRVAVVVGNDTGALGEKPLHFAESDAGKLARVLGELGGVAPEDLLLLQGKGVAALTDAFAVAKKRIAAHRRNPADRVIVLFYFSGHSDGEALELGRDRLTFAELRRWLTTIGADVRVALVDSCKSGALLATKGGTRSSAFQIRLTDDLGSSGEALLTSSAADEVALESSDIGGSFFTHHLVSGLRGAADSDGDDLVTLTEAYQYAYAHTIVTTGETIIGPQHPTYDYRLSGRGELVLTELGKRTASLELPSQFERALVIEVAHNQVIAELTAGARPIIAVQPGRYAIRAWRSGKLFAGRVVVAANESRAVRWDELAATSGATTATKGGLAQDGGEPHAALLIGGGGTGGVANGLGVVATVRAELRLRSGLDVAMMIGSKHRTNFRETSSLVFVGYRRGVARGRVGAWLALDVGVGAVVQTAMDVPAAYSGALAIAPRGGLSFAVAKRMSIALEAELTAELIRRDGEAAVVALPAGWLGVLVDL